VIGVTPGFDGEQSVFLLRLAKRVLVSGRIEWKQDSRLSPSRKRKSFGIDADHLVLLFR